MRYKTLILILMSIICLACVEANIMCYQPMANISNCGNPLGGYYYIDAAYNNWTNNNSIRDGDFSTYSNASNVNYETAIMSRFLMPPYANNYSKTVWRKQSAGQFNITLSNNVSGIWSTKIGSYIQFTHYSMNLPVTPRMGVNTYMYVYNSSSYILYLVNESYTASLTTPANSHYYESGIWWNLSIEPIYPINGSTIQSPQVNVTYPIWDGNYYDYENISIFYDNNFKRKINKSTFSFCQQDSFTTSSNCGNSDNATCWIESGTGAWANGGAGTCGYDGGWGYANPSTGTAYEYQNITSNIYSQGIKNNSLITLSYYKYGGLESCGGTGYTYYLINKTINNTCFKSSMRFNITVMRPIVNGQTQGIYLQCLNSSAGWTTIYSDTWAAFSFCYISSIGYDGFSINWNLTNPIYNLTDSLFLSEGRHNISIEASNSTFTGNITNTTFFVDYSETINLSTAIETQLASFYLYLNKSSGLTTNANITFNGTFYTPTKITGTDYDIYTAQINMPLVPGIYSSSYSYMWNYSVTDGTSTSLGNTSGLITVTKVIVYPCNNASLGNVTSLYIVTKDENTASTLLKSRIEIEAKYYQNDPTNYSTANYTLTDGWNYSICVHPNITIYGDIFIKYNVSGGFSNRWYIYNGTFNNISQNLTLYNYDYTTGISELDWIVRDKSNYKYYPNVVASLERNYVGEGLWRTVQMSQSDNFGLTLFNVREKDTDYRLVFRDTSNNLLDSTTSMRFSCTSGLCSITYLLLPFASTIIGPDISASATFNNNTKIVTINWKDNQGKTTTINTLVTKTINAQEVTICDLSQTGTGGTQTCNVSNYTDTVWINIFATKNGQNVSQFGQTINIPSQKLFNLVGKEESYFWTFGIMLTTAMFGVFSPVGAIMAMLFGLISAYLLGIGGGITYTVIILACVIGMVIGFKVKS